MSSLASSDFQLDVTHAEPRIHGITLAPVVVFRIHVLYAGDSWVIHRRYSQFVTLHSELNDLYPDVKLPRLPPKTIALFAPSSAKSSAIQKRLQLLQTYATELIKDSVVRQSPVVLDWIQLANDPWQLLSMQNPTKSGWVGKETPVIKTWSKRFMILKEDRLYICKSSQAEKPTHAYVLINALVNVCMFEAENQNVKKLVLELHCSEPKLVTKANIKPNMRVRFQFASPHQLASWLVALVNAGVRCDPAQCLALPGVSIDESTQRLVCEATPIDETTNELTELPPPTPTDERLASPATLRRLAENVAGTSNKYKTNLYDSGRQRAFTVSQRELKSLPDVSSRASAVKENVNIALRVVLKKIERAQESRSRHASREQTAGSHSSPTSPTLSKTSSGSTSSSRHPATRSVDSARRGSVDALRRDSFVELQQHFASIQGQRRRSSVLSLQSRGIVKGLRVDVDVPVRINSIESLGRLSDLCSSIIDASIVTLKKDNLFRSYMNEIRLLLLLGSESVHPLVAEMFETYSVLARWLELCDDEHHVTNNDSNTAASGVVERDAEKHTSNAPLSLKTQIAVPPARRSRAKTQAAHTADSSGGLGVSLRRRSIDGASMTPWQLATQSMRTPSPVVQLPTTRLKGARRAASISSDLPIGVVRDRQQDARPRRRSALVDDIRRSPIDSSVRSATTTPTSHRRSSPRESSDQQSTPHRRRRRTAMATCRICESVMSLNDLYDHSLVCSLVNAESIRELSSAEQLDWLFTQLSQTLAVDDPVAAADVVSGLRLPSDAPLSPSSSSSTTESSSSSSSLSTSGSDSTSSTSSASSAMQSASALSSKPSSSACTSSMRRPSKNAASDDEQSSSDSSFTASIEASAALQSKSFPDEQSKSSVGNAAAAAPAVAAAKDEFASVDEAEHVRRRVKDKEETTSTTAATATATTTSSSTPTTTNSSTTPTTTTPTSSLRKHKRRSRVNTGGSNNNNNNNNSSSSNNNNNNATNYLLPSKGVCRSCTVDLTSPADNVEYSLCAVCEFGSAIDAVLERSPAAPSIVPVFTTDNANEQELQYKMLPHAPNNDELATSCRTELEDELNRLAMKFL